jgi:hypothetical protein
MQSKIIAAAVATSAAALKLQDIPAEFSGGKHVDGDEYHTPEGGSCEPNAEGKVDVYACLEFKTEEALNKVFNDVTGGDECTDGVDEAKDDIIKGLEELKETLVDGLMDTVMMLTDGIADKIEASDNKINGEVDDGIQEICDLVEGCEDEILAKRDEIEQWVKDLVYKCNHINLESADYCDPYEVKEKIQYKLDYFDRFLQEKLDAIQARADEIIQEVEDTIAEEKQCLADLVPEILTQYNDEADAATTDLNNAIDEAIEKLDGIIDDAMACVDGGNGGNGGDVPDISDNFLTLFWEALESLNDSVDPYERRALIHKALIKKDEFIDRMNDASGSMMGDLADCRDDMMDKFAECRDKLAGDITDKRDMLMEDTQGSLDEIADEAHDRLVTTIEEKLGDGGDFGDHARFLEEWVHKIANHLVKHKPFQFKPHAALVTNTLQGQVDTYGDAIFATFDSVTGDAVNALNNVVLNNSNSLHGTQQNITGLLDNTLSSLIRNIINSRENLEVNITEMQDDQEAADEAQRDLDEVALVSTKNQLWKDLSWTMRKAYGGHSVNEPVKSHGYAQVSTNPFGFESKTELWNEIKALLDAMSTAQADITDANEARIADSKAALDSALTGAVDAYDVVLANKKASMADAIAAQQAIFDAQVADSTGKVNDAIADARAAIDAANEVKVAALDKLEKEIRWGITAVYNDLWQGDLEAAMDAARAQADADCAAKNADLDAALEAALANWNSAVDSETSTLGDNTAADTAACDVAAEEQGAALADFVAASVARFDSWADNERSELADFVAECSAAWNTILASYCLDDIEYLDEHHNGLAQVADSDINFGLGKHYSHGCRAFGQIGGYEKTEIEVHDEVLSRGQDLEIKHIDNIEERVAAAVDYVMEGIPEVAAEQAGIVADTQAAIDASVDEARVALEGELSNRLADAIASMDNTVDELSTGLQDRQADVEASVDASRVAATENVVEQKEAAIANIDSEIWKLGYGQPGAFDPYYDYSVDTANYDDHPIPRSIQHPEDFA